MAYDVAVVGAGPGGSSTAAALARRGVSVALIDRSMFPRDKVCGGAVSPRALSSLDAMGLLPAVERGGFRRINGVRVAAPNGTDVRGDAPSGTPYRNYGYTVLRAEFDDLMRRHAVDAGAEFICGAPVIDVIRGGDGAITGVVLRRDGRTEVEARAVVGADGAGSVVARKSGLYARDTENLGVAVRVVYANVGGLEDYVEFHYDRSVLPGYAWIFPLADDRVNIGLGGFGDRFKRAGTDVFHLLDVFIRTNRWARDRLKDARVVMEPAGWALPMGGRTPMTVADGVVLVGDSAHQINPLTGEGIEYAMEAGAMAADVLAKALDEGDLSRGRLMEYDRRWRDAFMSDFDDSIRIRDMMERQSLVNMLVRRARKKPALASDLAGIIANMLPKERYNTRFKWFRRMI
ncbi:MAG: NAD(P)/FAD-dependent oxidoreductase [Thermoplasmata archaeon]|nr:NAD(P)/FAD-dependent oxidoreductase [Thermoplasmata archaeon]